MARLMSNAVLVLAGILAAEAAWTPRVVPRSQPSQLWHQQLSQSTCYLPVPEREQIYRALELAHVVHDGQLRRDGSDFVSHPVAVAQLVSDWRMDGQCVAAALLHDSIEDTQLTLTELEDCFGSEVAFLVQGVTAASKMPHAGSRSEGIPTTRNRVENEDLLDLLNACAADWRVAVLKLADRLHNMRTLAAMSPSKRAAKAQETERVYVPLAHYLGAHEVGAELAELAARHRADDRMPSMPSWVPAWTRSLPILPSSFSLPRPAAADSILSFLLSGGKPSPVALTSVGSASHLRRLIAQLEKDVGGRNVGSIDEALSSGLFGRLRPLHERLARHQFAVMRTDGGGEA